MLLDAPHVRGASYVTYLATLATLVGFLVAGTSIYRTSLRQGTNCLGSKVATTGTGGACNGVDEAEVVVEASKVFALTTGNGPRCDANGACSGGACFAAGTPVLTPSGERPIEAIVAGDLVLSKDVESGEVAAREVVATKVTYGKPALLLELEAESGHREVLTVTPNHPFFVEGRGFLAAERLSSDDRVTTSTGRARVLGIAESAMSEPVYNFEVASFHTYFVGKTHALVHNDCDGAAWQAPYEERDAANVLAIARKYAELNQAFEALAKTKPGTPESIAAGDKARRLAIEL